MAAGQQVRVTGWRVTLVNQEVRRLPAAASLELCQAIPPVAIAPVVRWSAAAHRRRVRLGVRPPGHPVVRRRIVLHRGAGRAAPVFTPRTLGLREDAFEGGLHRLTVRRHGRTLARASLRFTSPDGPC